MVTVTKLKHEHEIFVLLVVEQQLSATEAYKKAYPKSHPAAAATSASRLMKNVKIQARIAEVAASQALVARAATRITSQSIIEQLQVVADRALAQGQLTAASNALMGIAKVAGLLVEKHMVDTTIRRPSARPDSPDEMSEDQWLQEFSPIAIPHTIDAEVVSEEEVLSEVVLDGKE